MKLKFCCAYCTPASVQHCVSNSESGVTRSELLADGAIIDSSISLEIECRLSKHVLEGSAHALHVKLNGNVLQGKHHSSLSRTVVEDMYKLYNLFEVCVCVFARFCNTCLSRDVLLLGVFTSRQVCGGFQMEKKRK
eukprot:6444263-Amphidinium_carterae.1